jgi:hypothetical protein
MIKRNIFLLLFISPLVFFSLKSKKKFFIIKIEQGGKIIPIEKNVVELEKGKFTIILEMKGIRSVLLACDTSDKSYKLFQRDDVKMENIPSYQNTPMAETRLNESKKILIHPHAPSCWYYDGKQKNSFNQALVKKSKIIGRREVENYRLNRKDYPIDMLNGKLYFTFLHYKEGKDMFDRIPLQKEYFMIKWK